MRSGKLVGLFLCTALVMTGAGCSKSANVAQTQQPAAQTSPAADSTQLAAGQNAAATNDAKSATGVFGQVTSINGSTVVVALAQMPQRQDGGQPGGGQPPAGQPGGTQQGGGQPPEQGSTPPADGQKAASPQLTGESKTITIPSTARIVSGGRDNSTQLSISDIKAGDMIEIRYSSTDSTLVEQVNIMKTPTP